MTYILRNVTTIFVNRISSLQNVKLGNLFSPFDTVILFRNCYSRGNNCILRRHLATESNQTEVRKASSKPQAKKVP